jgi:GT2 family glycosyltransferase
MLTATERPLVSVVLLSYNRPGSLERAIESVLAQTYQRLEILVVDNRSAESPAVAALTSRYSRVRLIANAHNLGFAAGMNAGIAAASGRYVYLTEDDIELDPQCLACLIDHMERSPDVGVSGAVMLNRATGTIRCAGGYVDLGGIYRMTIIGEGEAPSLDRTDPPYRVGYLPGATMMVRLELLRELKGFREEFFMYSEDTELCVRVQKRGLALTVVPTATVSHQEPGEATADLGFHKVKNLAAMYLLHARLRVLPAFVLRYGVVDTFRAVGGARGGAATHLRAWCWVLVRAPRLLNERFRAGWFRPGGSMQVAQ